MTLQIIVFVMLVALTLINNGVQLYIHFEAYPLFKFVGKTEFATYLKEYERRLTAPLLIPYGLTLLLNLLVLLLRPEAVPLVALIVVLVLNLSVAAVTMIVATPVYTRIKDTLEATGEDMQRLMTINLIRLVLSTVASAVLLVLLLILIAA